MTTRSVVIPNALGLHARAAARFVRLATTFESRIEVSRAAAVMDGRSISGILLLAAGQGTTVVIHGDGPDEVPAVEALARLVESGFGETPWSD